MGDKDIEGVSQTKIDVGENEGKKVDSAEKISVEKISVENSVKKMHKRVTKKDDGRSLIYYTFNEGI